MQAPFGTFMDENLSQSAMFPQESEGSKSGQSSPVYQDEVSNSFIFINYTFYFELKGKCIK